MQTIHINVDDSKMDILLNIVNNLKDDVVKSYSISQTEDAFYDERKKRLMTLREDIKSGKEPMVDFENSVDELIEELQA
jgi:hypothetical protein